MKTTTTLAALALCALAFAPAADAWSACLAVSCTQVEENIHTPAQTNAQTQVCAGNVQVGVAGGNQQQCQQTAYQCNVNGEDVETDSFQKRARSEGCNGGSSDVIKSEGVLITFA